MNTNRNSNRRRGRGNNRGPGGGNNQGNRIDSRARGNAPQLLEKYRKLAHDASMNDDRVQTEYYLQFADHYFRVLADSRSQKDETRGRRDFDREQAEDEDQEEELEETSQERSPRERPSRERPARERPSRNGEDAPAPAAAAAEEGSRGVEGEEEAADEANPFIRDTRSNRRQRTRTRAKHAGEQVDGEADSAGVDPAVLPPSIARTEEEGSEEKPARPRATRTRTRRTRPADNGDAEALEAVS